ncbi:MAG: NAD(P)H-binding protein, partial [Candidatus Nanopelagicales bacterium]
MRVTVFGATGGTGHEVLAQALAAGHEGSVLVRDPAKLGAQDPRVRVEVGDARDPDAVARAVAGGQGAISCVGGSGLGRSTLVTECVQTIVRALPTGARLLTVSTVGAGDSGSQMPLPVRATIGLLLRNAIADHDGAELAVMGSDLDWTIARCVGLTDEPARGEAHVTTSGRVGGSRIPRADVAAWLVAGLADPTYSRRAVT